MPITLAILGGQLEIKTMYGKEFIHIQAGTQPESVILLEKKSVPQVNVLGSGDHYLHVKVEIPRNLNAKQIKLVEELGKNLT